MSNLRVFFQEPPNGILYTYLDRGLCAYHLGIWIHWTFALDRYPTEAYLRAPAKCTSSDGKSQDTRLSTTCTLAVDGNRGRFTFGIWG